MNIIRATRSQQGLEIKTDAGMLRLQAVSDRIVHVLYTLQDAFSSTPSLVVVPGLHETNAWDSEEDFDRITFSTARLRLQIDKKSGSFSWTTVSAELLVREPERGGKTLREIEVGGQKAYSTKLELVFSPGEAIYGLGQHEEGVLNYRGRSEMLYQHNLKVAMPVMVSTRGYAILFDHCSLSNFHDDQYGAYFWSEVEDELDFYFILGPEFDDLVAGVRALTGAPTLFPKWAYGYVQSKERYKKQSELVEIVQEYRRRGIGLDCIVLDWMSWPGKFWGQKTFDPDRFPDPDKLTRDLHELNTRLMISVWPKFDNNGSNQVEMREQGCLLGDGVTYDAFNPRARALYWKQANEGLFSHGVDAWWCDSSEPFEPDWHGPVKPEPWERMVTNTTVFKKNLDPSRINAYSLLHSKGMYEGQRSATTEKRMVNLTRSGYPGQVRYGTITWSGDVTARWETLKKQIPAGLNFTVTGSPRWTFDIGGFFVDRHAEQWFWDGAFHDGIDDRGYRELFLRWFQLGAFLPMFRTHGTDTPREVWRFGKPGEVFYDTLVKFIRLRYRLLPYIYSLAAWETYRGYTMLRSLAFDFRDDPQVLNIADQFMLGPALMVCPVTEPMVYGPGSETLEGRPKERTIYLPPGSGWYNFWTGKRYGGGQILRTPAPLDILPLFVRAGSILPMGPDIQYAGEKPGAPIELRVYPGRDSSFDLYDDEGDSYRYEQGEFAWTALVWDDAARRLSIGPRAGTYRGMPLRQAFEIVLGGAGIDPGEKAGSVSISGPERAEWAQK